MSHTPPTPDTISAGVEIMLSGVRGIPDHILEGFTLAEGAAASARGGDAAWTPRRVTLCALGGSAFPGDLLWIALRNRNTHFNICRDYEPPTDLTADDLVIVSSFSGNTEEALAALDLTCASPARAVVVCAGGALEARARARSLPLIRLYRPTPTFQPRAATGFFLGALTALLEDLGVFAGGRARLTEVARQTRALTASPTLGAEAAEVARALNGKIPVLYAPPPFASSVARIAKIKINENAKSPAFWNEVPELNHNEMVGYTRLHAPLIAVFLTTDQTPPRQQTRVTRSIETLHKHGVATLALPMRAAPDPLASALATLYLFDLVSCELAVMGGVDPNPVAMVEDFKASLGAFASADQP
jgi:glucose/mannose-6-phosphate isomerase